MNKIEDSSKIGGAFTLRHIRDGKVIGEETFNNIITTEGINLTQDTLFNSASQHATWYLSIFKNNYTPLVGDTMSNFTGGGVAGEISGTDIVAAVREDFTTVASAAGLITNSASKASFVTATDYTAVGAFITTESVLGGTTGSLFAAAKFGTARPLLVGDTLEVIYNLQLT